MIILVTSILTAYNKKRCSPLVQALSERTKNRDYFRKQAVHKSAPYPLSGSLLQLFLQFVPLLGRSSRSKANIGRLFPLRFIYSLNYNYCIYINAWMLIATQLFTAP